jgi:hypothetical protein
MKLAWTILKRLLVWIFPVLMLENCMNRDPHLKIDERFSLVAICGSCPMALIYRDDSLRWPPERTPEMTDEDFSKAMDKTLKALRWQLREITDYKLTEKAIIGRSPDGHFIADRITGVLRLFRSNKERDQALEAEYHLRPDSDFHPPSTWMWARSRYCWPWFHLYSLACFILIPWLTTRPGRLVGNTPYILPK